MSSEESTGSATTTKPDQQNSENSPSPAAELACSNQSTPSKKPSAAPKITLILRPVGDAPIAKQQKWMVEPSRTVAWVAQFLRKYLKLEADEQSQLHLFVNQCFAPSLDESLDNLCACFATDGKLVLHYCLTMAWG